jgi:hypothetical protein
MRSTFIIACYLIALTLLIVPACQREVSDQLSGPHSTEQVTATITGRIIDHAGMPVKDAVVKAGTANTTTDINGVFSLKNVRIDKNTGFIKVEKPGFFQGSRTIVVHEGATNYVSIQLIQKNVSGTVSGNSNGTVTVANGGTIAFTAGSFINSTNNTAYTGTVSVSAFFLNPADGNFNEIMPGALRGINAQNEETGLQSFGMMAVELNGAAGEKLQLASGKPATITFPIPAGLLAQAPATIPLWSFNDTTGLWKQEGTATRQGNNYVGTVNHFSFWNCDAPFPVVDFKAVIKDQAGNPLYPAIVQIRTTDDKISLYGYGCTDNNGMVSGQIPSGKMLELTVLSDRCRSVLHTQNIGPFSAKADIGTVTVNNINAAVVTISGTAVNCSGGAVTNGFVDIIMDGLHNHALVTNGNFSISITRCNNVPGNAAITAYDVNASQNGPVTNIAVTTGAVATGQVSACGNALTQFVNYTLSGTPRSFIPPADSLQLYTSTPNAWTLWAARKGNGNDQVYMTFTASGTGNAPVSYLNVSTGNNSYFKQAFNMTITEFGPVGGYIIGHLATTLRDSANRTAPVTLNFRAKREN